MKFILSILAALTVTGCASAVSRPAERVIPWPVRQAQLSGVQDWEMRGRVALSTGDNRGGQASLSWRHQSDRNTIFLRGPFGGSLLRIQQDVNGAELQDGKQNIQRADTSEELLFNATGWRVPLAGLEHWVLGIPVPNLGVRQEVDEHGKLKSLQQLGWNVSFLEYSASGEFELPNRLDLVFPAMDDADRIEARIVVDQWVIK